MDKDILVQSFDFQVCKEYLFKVYCFVLSCEKITDPILIKLNEWFQKFQKEKCYYFIDLQSADDFDVKIFNTQKGIVSKMDPSNEILYIFLVCKELYSFAINTGLKVVNPKTKTKSFSTSQKAFQGIKKNIVKKFFPGVKF